MNNDLISRKWLTDAIRNRRTYLSYEDAKDVIELIDNAPTVELDENVIQEILNKRCMTAVANEYLIALHGKRPQGKWIQISPAKIYECNLCHKTVMTSNIEEYCFCIGCGAKMQKGGAE